MPISENKDKNNIKELILDQLNICVWAKDKKFKYLYCNEVYAESAGLDSPNQIVGRTDDAMPWRKQADHFREGDHDVFQGHIRINVPEIEVTKEKVADILVTESRLNDRNGKCIGLVGSYIDITGKQLVKKSGYYNKVEKRYYLGADFGNEYLTIREIEVLKRLLLGYTAAQAGASLKISPKTVESYIENLRIKLQAHSKGEIIATAIQYGLTQLLYLQICSTSSSSKG